MNEILSDDEIFALTKPIKQGCAQARHLSALLGCEVKRRADGRPIVTRAMLDRLDPKAKAQNDSGINWSRQA